MTKQIVGIDPGKHGGLALLRDSYVDVSPMPLLAADLDLSAIRDWVRGVDLVVIELVQSFPKMARVASVSLGRQFGLLEGICYTLNVPYVIVRSQAWKKLILSGYKTKGLTDREKKQISVKYCQRRFPNIGWKKTDDGPADALCLALYGQQVFGDELNRKDGEDEAI